MKYDRPLALVVLIASITASGAVVGAAQSEPIYIWGEPELSIYAPNATLAPGSTTTIAVQVANEGDLIEGDVPNREMVTTARGVTVDPRGAGPLTVESGPRAIGALGDSQVKTVPITVTVPSDVDPGTYSLDLRLRYSHTYHYSTYNDDVVERSRSVARSVDLQVSDDPRFELRTVDSDVWVGGTGTITADLTNVGAETARELTVALESTSEDVTLGKSGRNTVWVDALEPGENATLTYEATLRPDASTRNISLAGSVTYTDAAGKRAAQEGLSIGVRAKSEQSFTVSVDESSLRVGEVGTIRGTIRNTGPADVNDVVLSLEDPQLRLRNPTFGIGSLGAGQTAQFQFRGTVPVGADPVPTQIDIVTRYRTDDETASESVDSMVVPVADRRHTVDVAVGEGRFAPGESGVLVLDVTNRRDTEIEDVVVNISVEEPLSSEFRTAVIPSLAPNETGRVALDLEVDGDAHASQFPATVGIRYTDHEDRSVTARPSTVAITVTESEGTDLSTELFIFGGLVIVVAAGAWWFYRRR